MFIPKKYLEFYNLEKDILQQYPKDEIIYLDETLTFKLTPEEKISQHLFDGKNVKDPILELINIPTANHSIEVFNYYVKDVDSSAINIIDKKTKEKHTAILSSYKTVISESINNTIAEMKYELLYLFILVISVLLLTYQMIISSYHSMKSKKANQLLHGVFYMKRYWYYYVSIPIIYSLVYHLTVRNRLDISNNFKITVAGCLFVIAVLDMILTSLVLKYVDKKYTLEELNDMS